MAIDALSRKAGALAVIAATGLSLAFIPAPALAGTPAHRPPAPATAGVQVADAPDVPKLPDGLSALSWAVTDAESGSVLAAKDLHRRLPPASTLKTLFAVTALPKFAADSVRQVSAADLEGVGAGSSLVGVTEGGSYTVADLWRGVFLRSGNDAVHVLASMNGGWDATAREMQQKARSLGAEDTTVQSPDGYDTPGQVSSAYDLTVFARAGLANADFARYCSTAQADFPTASGVTRIENTNRLLSGAGGMTRYPGIIGVKNGYTTNAGNTLIAAARRDGHTLLVTVMNPQSGQANGVYKEAASLLDWGFESVDKAEPISSMTRAVAQSPQVQPAAHTTQTDERGGSPWRDALALWAGGIGATVLAMGAAVAWRLHARRRAAAARRPEVP
ncbi:D-alanyl-D-alanine carboxypeptidase family protein [Streptomyces pinistramenti]|uniref:D-alanyl-D-alanine carboxypeptidase family protein n=1 Tax=Streptomyces pinistramenti TaxID=2884812 RepID=UPI001D06851E|nr:serine hydrolase [Streptomyces pinistramenti]MCB5912124.1 D-alanyl-D-alanine carboxypeptidase [Streptomyces pinistramenti]